MLLKYIAPPWFQSQARSLRQEKKPSLKEVIRDNIWQKLVLVQSHLASLKFIETQLGQMASTLKM